MREISFALLREGNSDEGLVAHIRSMLLDAGADSAVGAPRAYPGTIAERLARVLAEPSLVDIVFVHRDSDQRDPNPRYIEIEHAVAPNRGWEDRVVAVVPVQELEAWLLTDAAAIRAVVGKPTGRTDLNLPPVNRIESTARPKERLRDACVAATESTGARRRSAARNFSRYRETLLERLDPTGPVATLSSWQAFERDTKAAARSVLAAPLQDRADRLDARGNIQMP